MSASAKLLGEAREARASKKAQGAMYKRMVSGQGSLGVKPGSGGYKEILKKQIIEENEIRCKDVEALVEDALEEMKTSEA